MLGCFFRPKVPNSKIPPLATRTLLGTTYIYTFVSSNIFAHHPTCTYHHDHTIQGMFKATTSSPLFASHLTVVMSWSHKVIVIFKSNKASRVPLRQCQNILLQPTWTWTKLKQQASFTQGMSAPHRYPDNILDQYNLTILCSTALPSSRILSNQGAHKSQVSYPGLILHPFPCLMFSPSRLSCFERIPRRLSEKKKKTITLLLLWLGGGLI